MQVCTYMGKLLQDGKFSLTLNKNAPQCWLYCDPMFSDMEDPQVSLVQSWVGHVGYYKKIVKNRIFHWFLGWFLRDFFRKLKITQCLIANCSAHRWPTKMCSYFLKRPCPDHFKNYKTIFVGSLWAEQFAIQFWAI